MSLVRKPSAVVSFVLAVVVAGASTASAQSIMDRLKNAAKNPNTQSQPQGQKQGGAAPSSGNSVTNLNGLDNYNKCMARSSGYHEKLLAEMLQHHLDTAKNDAERKKIQEDIDYLTATSKGQRVAAPDPRNSQRYLLVITDDEQVAANTEFSRYSNEVREFCEERYGGMSQFGDPAGRRPKAKLPEPVQQEPVVVATAARARPRNELADCMAARNGLQWKLMADRIEAKLGATPGLSATERKGWEEDIAMLRATAENPGKGMPQSPDPKNPTRYFTRLSGEEQMAVNQEYAAQSRSMMTNCTGGSNSAGGSSSPYQAERARRRAEAANAPSQTAVAEAAKAEAQAWMDAHPMAARKEVRPTHGLGAGDADYLEKSGTMACFDRVKGFRAKLMADRLTSKRDSVAPQDRRELDAWIAAWRAVEHNHADAPSTPSGSNPNRDLQFLMNSDQQEINMANSIVSNKVRDECNSVNPFGSSKK
jgi:hypothetical protein